MEQVSFTRMADGTAEDYALLDREHEAYYEGRIGDALLDQLVMMKGPTLGYKIDRYEHSLQSATRALRDGRSEEYVVSALLHDVGDPIAPDNHSEIAAAVLRPYISHDMWWIIKHHGLFQGYYYFHHTGRDQNARDLHKDHPLFDACAEFCELYDQNCFDPGYENESLETFRPMVTRIFARKPWTDAGIEQVF